MTPLLSILILSVPNRIQPMLVPLYDRLMKQAGDRKDVEILCLIDNKVMSIGEKRNKLLLVASGGHLAFLDDDDEVADDYIETLVECVRNNPSADVVAFRQHCTVNGNMFMVDFDLRNENEAAGPGPDGKWRDIKRKPYHMCVWKSVIAKNTPFENVSYGEDLIWVTKLAQRAKTQVKLDKTLHFYRYSDQTSESIKRRDE